MTSNKRIRIFLKKNNQLLNFMWADVSSDGSVMMGVCGSSFSTSILKIVAKEGELLAGEEFHNVDERELVNSVKISFHKSGFFKLVNKIKKGSVDRMTIKGIPFKAVSQPIRMLEVLIPAQIGISTSKPRDGIDTVVDITEFPHQPLRCTVICMPVSEINQFYNNKKIDTSIIEASCIYEANSIAWGWVIRVSKNDKIVDRERFYVFIHGDVVWPSRFLLVKKIWVRIRRFFRKFR